MPSPSSLPERWLAVLPVVAPMAKHATPSGSGTATRRSPLRAKRSRFVPVFVHQIAEPQIGDARAADLANASQWRGVLAHAEQDVDPVAAALQRRPVMRRAEENELVDPPRPFVARQRAVMEGAAGDEPPMLCPISTSSVNGTGQRRTRVSSCSANARPLVEMWSPLL